MLPSHRPAQRAPYRGIGRASVNRPTYLYVGREMLSPLTKTLRCLQCGSPVADAQLESRSGYPELGPDGWLPCTACRQRYPVIAGTVRMLDEEGLARLARDYPEAAIELGHDRLSSGDGNSTRQRTADSFAYEWAHFGQDRPEWRQNFLDYLRPHAPESFAGKLVLDVGAGSGRHSAQAAALGAHVVAIDLGRSIDVARRNLPPEVLTVQADAERLPFGPDTFDLVMSIGVLHHLPDTQRVLNGLVPFVAPGGYLHVYLYWVPEVGWHRSVLRFVTAARRVTVGLPHPLLHALCYPLAAALRLGVVVPYRCLRTRPRAAWLAQGLPLKTYADYPFGVLVNDQFDRFSAPIEQRFTSAQVRVMLERAGLQEVVTIANHGWLADGRRRVDADRPVEPRPDRISIVIPVRDDRLGLSELLPRLEAQTLAPDEIIVVDGGSVDGTLSALDDFGPAGTTVRTIVAPGVNIAGGRNVGVRAARNEMIACTDAGCLPEDGWLAALRAGLQDADLASGPVAIDARTSFERVLALTHYPSPDELNGAGVLVSLSHRLFGRRYVAERAPGGSLAFRRDAWRAAGGFPERLYTGEDHAFARAISENGFTVAFVRGAVVHWRPPSSLWGNVCMFYFYCRGDIRSRGRSRHLLRLAAWSGGAAAAWRGGRRSRAAVALGGLAYVALPLRRARRTHVSPRLWWQIPALVALKDLSQLVGAAHGVIDALRGVPQPAPNRRSRSRSLPLVRRRRGGA